MINVYIIWNALVCLLYGFDKMAAKCGRRRISEKILLSAAVFMGGVGAFIGMELFRHKTKHFSFRFFVPVFCVINLVVLFLFKTHFFKDI